MVGLVKSSLHSSTSCFRFRNDEGFMKKHFYYVWLHLCTLNIDDTIIWYSCGLWDNGGEE